jgi:DNA-binding NarL/FixJ family response regulator
MDAIQESSAIDATKAIRILLLDDHEIARTGLRSILESREDWEVVEEARAGREALEQVDRLKPDVVVIAAGELESGVLERVREIRSLAPGTEVLVLATHASEDLLRRVTEAGACGYLLKSDARDHLVSAIESCRQQPRSRAVQVKHLTLEPLGRKLTRREREIVQLLAEGMTNKEVATMLGISVKTAETHRSNIMRKLGLHSVSGLVRYALRNHIIEA